MESKIYKCSELEDDELEVTMRNDFVYLSITETSEPNSVRLTWDAVDDLIAFIQKGRPHGK